MASPTYDFETLPTVVGTIGQDVSLLTILTTEFGANFGGYQDFYVGYKGPTFLHNEGFSYRNLNNEVARQRHRYRTGRQPVLEHSCRYRVTQKIGVAGAGWHVAGVADYNGDGKADILWHNDKGTVGVWEMNGLRILARADVAHLDPGAGIVDHHYDFI